MPPGRGVYLAKCLNRGLKQMHKSDALADDDQMLELDCPHARWKRLDNDRVDYRIPGFDACASVEKDPGTDYYAWSYFVSCAVKRSEVQGRHNDPDTCLGEAGRWLRFRRRPPRSTSLSATAGRCRSRPGRHRRQNG